MVSAAMSSFIRVTILLPLVVLIGVCLPWALVIVLIVQVDRLAAWVIKNPTERTVILAAVLVILIRHLLRSVLRIGGSIAPRQTQTETDS
jgi:hypothetical protein